MLKRLLALLAVVLAPVAAAAQTAPAQMGITPTTLPEVLQVLDNTQTWVTIGNVNPLTHTFIPVGGGGGGEADILVTDPTVGWVANTGQDNIPFVPALMAKMGPPTGFLTGYKVTLPAIPGNYTEYYFSDALVLSRMANYGCDGAPGQPQTYLIFDAGVDGVVQENASNTADGGAGGGIWKGCTFISMGYGVATANPITPNVLTTVGMTNDPLHLIPPPPWQPGDGVVAMAYQGHYVDYRSIVAAPPGTTITAVDGATGNLTLSNPVSPYLGQTNFPHSTAAFTQNASNNFRAGDVVRVGSLIPSYTFVASILQTTAANSVLVGATFDASAANLVAAVNNAAGQYVAYTPNGQFTAWGNRSNPEVTASYVNGSGVINFQSVYGNPMANTFVSTYTPSGTAAGTFGGATFSGANDATTCPAPCTGQQQQVAIWRLPLARAFKVQTIAGSPLITIVSGPHPYLTGLHGGDVVWGDPFPNFGSLILYTHMAAQFRNAVDAPGTPRNFQNGDAFVIGVNNFQAVNVIGTTPGNFLIGPDFATSSAHLNEAIANTNVPDRGVNYVPPSNVSNFTLDGVANGTGSGIASNSLTFSDLGGVYNPAHAYPSTYTPAGVPAGSFGATTFNMESATIGVGSFATTVYNATVTHPPGAEGNLWIYPFAVKRRTQSEADDNLLFGFPGGLSMLCNSSTGSNCTGSRDRNIILANGVGRMVGGNNTGNSKSWDQISKDHLVDIFDFGTIGSLFYGLDAEGVESGLAQYAFIGNALSTIFGAYLAGGTNSVITPTTANPALYPPIPGGPTMLGILSSKPNGLGLQGSQFFTGAQPLTVTGGIDNKQCVSLGGSPYQGYSIAFSMNGCATGSTFGFGWDLPSKTWSLGPASTNGVSPYLKIINATLGSNEYTGVGFGIGMGYGVELGDATTSSLNNARWFGMAAAKPSQNWHLWGDTAVNTAVLPGAARDWTYASTFSTTLTGPVTKGSTASVPVAACPPSVLPTTTLVSDATVTPDVNLGFQASCTANSLTFTPAAALNNASSGDTIKFLQIYGAAPVSNDVANPDYTATTIRSGSAANKDIDGIITLAAGSAVLTFVGTYASAPICTCQQAPASSGVAATDACTAFETTTNVTFTGTGTDKIKYHCIGRN